MCQCATPPPSLSRMAALILFDALLRFYLCRLPLDNS